MATVNLGAIKFNWKGAFNNSTAYAVDDVVSSGGSSYVCILASQGNAVSNGTYWNQMSAAGTNGTDLSTTLTTQGDILYRDGSGLQRLGAGTSGNALVTKGSGQNPVWEAVGADFSPIFRAYLGTTQGIATTTVTRINFTAESYDPDSVFDTTNKIFTVPSGKGGKYFLYMQSRKNNFAGARGEMFIGIVGGSDLVNSEQGNVSDSYNTIFTSTIVQLTAGQQLEGKFYHSDSGTRNLYAGATNTFFGGYRLTD